MPLIDLVLGAAGPERTQLLRAKQDAARQEGYLLLVTRPEPGLPIAHAMHLASMRMESQVSEREWKAITHTMEKRRRWLVETTPGRGHLSKEQKRAPFLVTHPRTQDGTAFEWATLSKLVLDVTGRGGLCISIDDIDRASEEDMKYIAGAAECMISTADDAPVRLLGAAVAVPDLLAKMCTPESFPRDQTRRVSPPSSLPFLESSEQIIPW